MFAIDGLYLHDATKKGLVELGVSAPSPVQERGIPPILTGSNTLLHAATGTGKTLAYLLPLLHQLHHDDPLRAVVFSPGVELAMQTLQVARALKPADLNVAAAVTTTNTKRQKKRLTKSTRLIVGTPDRLVDLFQSGKMKGVRLIVLDELDPILRSSHTAALEKILSRSEPKVQLIIASATLGGRSETFLERFLVDGVRIQTAAKAPPLTHRSVWVPPKQAKDTVLLRFLDSEPCRRAMIFVRNQTEQSHLESLLSKKGKRVVSVTREGSKQRRQAGLRAFRNGDAAYLLLTDSVARGLDVPDVDWVLSYDVPGSGPLYTHRSGRTARAGRPGTSVVFVSAGKELSRLRSLASRLDIRFER